ncbi:MAG: M20/M25/M40 family metallo-hydrolase [Flavobacteriales bacterium]|jgi:peptidase M28-like protein/type IX secretion system substrate protein|nr:hypothetical protein [Flavobacteriales bacterium]MCW8898590.1 M20/M25/M40 family metallo-hydrolase [Flavobacteriales bacterium]MCW8938920.1 M20/M25/M40 family metallo-hydrolase [Flavobacteriales bacterium]MCW8967754.1 M20/M25/M40 family metallo-hydrolase [Flavobacteriales bacterium]MCW8989847.1 M20/M25/M40 family metallo-hydrolase [Flavobacteriales bacterium]|tara:strand:+ start:29442 stop:30635 length:1194 start_codon:yes stop_codon:yes gene_type:complete
MKYIKIIVLYFFVLMTLVGKAQNPIVQNILNDIRMDSMTFFVKQLTGEEQVIIGGVPDTIFSRHKNQPGNEKAFQFVKQKFVDYGLQVDSLQFSATGKNLLGIKIGTTYPSKKFILGAHYDNVGSTVAPGADDNASGSAAVIEAARIFSNYNFPFTVIFALWDEEEQGLIGSNAYASFAASNNDTILGYINMDMLGWDGNNDSLADLHVRPVANSLQLADKAIEADSVYSIGLGLHIVNPGTGATDHAAFWNNGFTAIGINEEYDNDFNPYWHTPADLLGQFNLPFYEKCAKLAYATIAECALDNTIVLSAKEQDFEKASFNIYPNPVVHQLTIRKIDGAQGEYTIMVYNANGQMLHSVSTNHTMQLDVSNYPAGIYSIQIASQEQQFLEIKKWVKQ